MIIKHRLLGRRVLPVLALSTTLAFGGFAIDAMSASAHTVNAQQQVSQNWAGYVVKSSAGKSFSSVSGSWTQPAASNSSGQGYSAFWVGIGGSGNQSQALEQVGTSSDVANGQTQYYAWYELMPAAETKLNLAIQPGDHITGKVTVNGTAVTVSLSDTTTGQSVTKTIQMSNPDTSSAEWIAEAPSSETQGGGIQTLPLANFGQVTFGNASATADGHTGSISDPNWSAEQVQLNSAATVGYPGSSGSFTPAGLGGGAGQASAGASPTNVSSDGSSFSVSYTSNGGATQSSSGGDGYSAYPGGGNGYSGYPGGGYGYGGGNGYGYGYTGGDGYVPGVYLYTY